MRFDSCIEFISECLPGKDYDVLTIMAVAPNSLLLELRKFSKLREMEIKVQKYP